MNYDKLFEALREAGFEAQGSCVFKQDGTWVIGLIGMSGRLERKGTKAFVVCARPVKFPYMESPKKKFHGEPMEYPFKFSKPSRWGKIKYKSELLRVDVGRLSIDGDWSKLYEFLAINLPSQLQKLGVSGLENQLRKIKNPGFIEKLWLGQTNA